MDDDSDKSIALLAVQPRFANKLMDGTKHVEFRKGRFKGDISVVVVYSSSPIRRIIGFFSVLGVVEGSPKELWELFSSLGGITEEDYWAYYGEAPNAVAIVVQSVNRLPNPVPLEVVKQNSRAPQSFEYLRVSQFARLTRDMRFNAGAAIR